MLLVSYLCVLFLEIISCTISIGAVLISMMTMTMVAMMSMMTVMTMDEFTVTMMNMGTNYMVMPCVVPTIVVSVMHILISSCSLTITSIVTMSTMETVFIDISLAIISTISWLSRPLAIAIVTMESLNPVVITRCMAIISRLSRPLAISITSIAIVTMKPLYTTIYIAGSMAIAWLSLSLGDEADQGDGEDGGDGGHGGGPLT